MSGGAGAVPAGVAVAAVVATAVGTWYLADTKKSFLARLRELIAGEGPKALTTSPQRQQDMVRDAYAATAEGSGSCCVSSITGVTGSHLGYTPEELKSAGISEEEQNKMLGCGHPVKLADLDEGETVLDLGSGAGIDSFLASDQVGASGQVIGVDMTPEMLKKARAKAKAQGRTNVGFRLGEIEHLPVADNSVDVVISNCVINLSPDKAGVYAEIMRVLKPGGRIALSDVVATQELPASLRNEESLAC